MPGSIVDKGEGRRAAVRAVVGPPGSVRRWLLGTSVWLFGCLLASLYVPWGGKIVVFLIAVLVAITGFRARALLIGDEDDFGAAVKRTVATAEKASEAHDDAVIPVDADLGLTDPIRGFEGVPPAPIAEEQGPASDGDQGTA